MVQDGKGDEAEPEDGIQNGEVILVFAEVAPSVEDLQLDFDGHILHFQVVLVSK